MFCTQYRQEYTFSLAVIWPLIKAKQSSDWDFSPPPFNSSHIWNICRLNFPPQPALQCTVQCDWSEITERAVLWVWARRAVVRRHWQIFFFFFQKRKGWIKNPIFDKYVVITSVYLNRDYRIYLECAISVW